MRVIIVARVQAYTGQASSPRPLAAPPYVPPPRAIPPATCGLPPFFGIPCVMIWDCFYGGDRTLLGGRATAISSQMERRRLRSFMVSSTRTKCYAICLLPRDINAAGDPPFLSLGLRWLPIALVALGPPVTTAR